MTNQRQELQNRYDDAFFSLLIDEVAEQEGALLWEECERLNADPSAAVPESLHQKCLDLAAGYMAKEENARRRTKLRNTGRKVLLVAALAAVLFTTAFASMESFRVGVLNFTLEVKEKYSSLVTAGKSGTKTSGTAVSYCDGTFLIGYDFAGFELLEEYGNEMGGEIYFLSESGDRDILIMSSWYVDGMDAIVDTENADAVIEIEMGEDSGWLVVKDTRSQVLWVDKPHDVVLTVVTNGLTAEETVALARSIQYCGD